MSPARRIAPEVRFWQYANAGEGCWEWSGYMHRNGYGRLKVDGRSTLAHRLSWELNRGPIPEGLQIDHLCRNRRCVNPEHLEPVTAGENTRRSPRANPSHCAHGHEYTAANTYVRTCGRRQCRACKAEREKRRGPRRRPVRAETA